MNWWGLTFMFLILNLFLLVATSQAYLKLTFKPTLWMVNLVATPKSEFEFDPVKLARVSRVMRWLILIAANVSLISFVLENRG